MQVRNFDTNTFTNLSASVYIYLHIRRIFSHDMQERAMFPAFIQEYPNIYPNITEEALLEHDAAVSKLELVRMMLLCSNVCGCCGWVRGRICSCLSSCVCVREIAVSIYMYTWGIMVCGLYICICISKYVYTQTYIHMYIYAHMYVCVLFMCIQCLCVFKCMHAHAYTYLSM